MTSATFLESPREAVRRAIGSTKRKRQPNSAYAKNLRWARCYRSRMDAGLEECRACGDPATTWGHIVAWIKGGSFHAGNITLLCLPCNRRQGSKHWKLRPLCAESDFEEIVGYRLCCEI